MKSIAASFSLPQTVFPWGRTVHTQTCQADCLEKSGLCDTQVLSSKRLLLAAHTPGTTWPLSSEVTPLLVSLLPHSKASECHLAVTLCVLSLGNPRSVLSNSLRASWRHSGFL